MRSRRLFLLTHLGVRCTPNRTPCNSYPTLSSFSFKGRGAMPPQIRVTLQVNGPLCSRPLSTRMPFNAASARQARS